MFPWGFIPHDISLAQVKDVSSEFGGSSTQGPPTELSESDRIFKSGLEMKCLATSGNPTTGKILKHAVDQITSMREEMGVRLCIFKIGVTCHPARRFEWYLERGYTCMWVLTQSDSIDLIHMLEAALTHEFGKHVGCKNRPNSGGEGALNRANVPSHPPYYTYVVGGRADQPRWVGWNYFQAAVASKLPLACGLPVDSHYLAKKYCYECWVLSVPVEQSSNECWGTSEFSLAFFLSMFASAGL